jgi:hypothetical protein
MFDELYFAYRTNVSRIQQIQHDVYIYLTGDIRVKNSIIKLYCSPKLVYNDLLICVTNHGKNLPGFGGSRNSSSSINRLIFNYV